MLMVTGHTGASTALVCVMLTDDRRSSTQVSDAILILVI